MEAAAPNSEVTFLSDQEYRERCPDNGDYTELNRANAEVCQACGGECCQIINCILYSHRFQCCPVYDYRPLGCRDWFCGRVGGEGSCLTEAEIAELQEIAEPDWIPSQIRERVEGIIASLNRGELSPAAAEAGIKELVQAYHQQGL